MTHAVFNRRLQLVRTLVVLVASCVMAGSAMAQSRVVTFDLENVWLDPDWGENGHMTGTFEWTYDEGDFENGTGHFTDLFIPWSGAGIRDLVIDIQPTEIGFSLIGNYHDWGVDISIFLTQPFSPTEPAPIDLTRSSFEIQNGVIRRGRFISGSIVPRITEWPAELTGIDVQNGTLIAGGINELLQSEDAYVQTRSGLGSTLIDLHNMTMNITAHSNVQNPTLVKVTVESSIDEPLGTATLRLRNWNMGLFDTIQTYALHNADETIVVPDLDATQYIKTGTGDIELQIKHVVHVPFLAFNFESLIDVVRIEVQ